MYIVLYILLLQDWRELLNQFLTKHGNSSDELGVLKFTTSFHSRSLFSFKRLLSPAPIPGAPIRPGLFKGTYGAHGIELIKLELTHAGMDEAKGVKVTGKRSLRLFWITRFS